VPTMTAPAVQQAGPLDTSAAQLVKKYLGVKYAWGGTNAQTGFDCSGLVQTVWSQLGVKVPRTTYEQWDAGQQVPVQNLKPGDAVFFTGADPKNGKPGHEGMYIGNGRFIEAPGSGLHVRVSNLAGRKDFVGARRFA
jgi:cell wall-associated NlpC family hydrolase